MQKLILILSLLSAHVVLAAPRFSDVAKNNDGTVRFFGQQAATRYCAARGARLPTIRELAEFAKGFGASGPAAINSGRPDDSYYLVSARNADGTVDQFYYSYVGFSRAAGFGHNGLWSSSVGDARAHEALYLSRDGIADQEIWAYQSHAVRCATD